MSGAFSGIRTLYEVLKRDISQKNDVLAQRKELSRDLNETCRLWSGKLLNAIADAVDRWELDDRHGAEERIFKIQNEFHELDYWSLIHSSPVLTFLQKDARFEGFAKSCAQFYKSAIELKRMLYGGIADANGLVYHADQTPLPVMYKLWRDEVRRMLHSVDLQYQYVRTLTPK